MQPIGKFQRQLLKVIVNDGPLTALVIVQVFDGVIGLDRINLTLDSLLKRGLVVEGYTEEHTRYPLYWASPLGKKYLHQLESR